MIGKMFLNTSPTQLECRGLGYQVGYEKKLSILDNVSFQAESGAFIGIVGPNGAGKSTLLRQLGGQIGRASCRERV